MATRPLDKRCYSSARRGQGRAAKTESEIKMRRKAAFTVAPVCGFTKKIIGMTAAVRFLLYVSASVLSRAIGKNMTLHILAYTLPKKKKNFRNSFTK